MSKKGSAKGLEASSNMDNEEKDLAPSYNFVPMNFKVESDFRKKFRLEAAKRNIPMKEFLEICFYTYLTSDEDSK